MGKGVYRRCIITQPLPRISPRKGLCVYGLEHGVKFPSDDPEDERHPAPETVI